MCVAESLAGFISANRSFRQDGRLTDARPQDPRQTIPEAPDRRSDDRSSRPWTRNLSAPLRYAKRPHRSCAIRYGVWGPLALITSSRTIFSPTYWTPLYFSHSVANVLAHCMPFSVCSECAPFLECQITKDTPKKATTRGFQRKKPRIEDEDPDAAQPSSSPLYPALLITSPPSPPSFSGPSSTGEWFRFLRFLFISLKHAAFSALHPSMPTRPRVFHPRSTTVHLLCLWLIPLSVRITL